jgi:hypothetical protein
MCVVIAVGSQSFPDGYTSADDRNGDGRLDVWRTYDNRHRLSEVAIDTNFDGRTDVYEYYERGELLRRDSDRDFNSRIDLIEEFDPATREHARSVIDVDFDGTADLLVLFQSGRPVFSRWAPVVTTTTARAGAALLPEASPRSAARELAPLNDPFRNDLSVRALRGAAGSSDWLWLSTSSGLPTPSTDVAGPLTSSEASDFSFSNLSSATLLQHSPRGPPAVHLPS